MRPNAKIRYDLAIALIYAGLGGAWILVSDRFLFSRVQGEVAQGRLSIAKGILFVLLGALLLYALLRRGLRQAEVHQSELAESRNRLDLAIRLAETAVWEYDASTEKLTFSANAAEVLNLDSAILEGGPQAFVSILETEDLKQALDLLKRSHEAGTPYRNLIPYRDREGQRRYLEVRADFAREPHGSGSRMLGTATDATEKLRLEAEVRSFNVGLEEQVAEQTAQLKETNQELAAFAHTVAHDLRAPLRAIAGYAMALQEDAAGKLDSECENHIARIRRSVDRMTSLIDGLLELSRVNRAELRLETLDLSELCAQVVEDLQGRMPERSLQVAIAPQMRLQGDSRLVKTLLDNVIGNAWKYTGPSTEPRIEIKALPTGGFEISDNGVGFDQQHAESMFEPFQRLHLPSEFPGSGIGLATVARIARRHGWHITALGEVGEGATFRFEPSG